MEEPTKRRRFQLHLSTAIVLMFAAGGIVWANVSMRKAPWPERRFFEHLYGWPYDALYSTPYSFNDEDAGPPTHWIASGIIINALVAALILNVVWYVCEWWIARRQTRV